jgi:hypothetical protein
LQTTLTQHLNQIVAHQIVHKSKFKFLNSRVNESLSDWFRLIFTSHQQYFSQFELPQAVGKIWSDTGMHHLVLSLIADTQVLGFSNIIMLNPNTQVSVERTMTTPYRDDHIDHID